jgi:DNA invertase Pin-like site-specific DNA recombinase/DNA-binding CsgD family transcriptional regulator
MQTRTEWGGHKGLDYADRERMHFVNQFRGDGVFRDKRWNPAWAANDKKIRVIVYNALWNYVQWSGAVDKIRPGMPFAELEALARSAQVNDLSTRKLNERQRHIVDQHLATTKNGVSGMWVRLIYLAYRQGYPATQIAEELNMSAPQVRQKLYRLNRIARRIYPDDCCEPHPSAAPFSYKHRSLTAFSKRKPGPKKASRFPSERVQEMAAMYAEGKPVGEIAKKFGTDGSYIGQLLRKAGIPRRGFRRYSPAVVQEMAAYYAEVKSQTAVAKKFNITHSNVYRVFMVNGIALPGRQTKTKYDVEAMVAMYAEGKSCKEVAAATGCSTHTVSGRLRMHGVKMRPAAPRKGIPRPRLPLLDADRMTQMVAMYSAGSRQLDIAKEFHLSQTYVGRVLKRQGVILRRRTDLPRQGTSTEQVEAMAARYQDGGTMESVASEFGINRCTLREYFKQLGIKTWRGRKKAANV